MGRVRVASAFYGEATAWFHATQNTIRTDAATTCIGVVTQPVRNTAECCYIKQHGIAIFPVDR